MRQRRLYGRRGRAPPPRTRTDWKHRFVRRPAARQCRERWDRHRLTDRRMRERRCATHTPYRYLWCGPARTHTTPRPRHHTPRARHNAVPRAPCPMPSRAPPSAHFSAKPCCVHATVPTGHAVPTFACMHGSQRAMPHACDGPNGPSSPVSSRRRRHTVHVDDGCHRERRERERGEWPVPAETDGQRAESEP